MPLGNTMRFGCGGWKAGSGEMGTCCQVAACAQSCTLPLTNRTRTKNEITDRFTGHLLVEQHQAQKVQ